ncbi:hypothetical protein BH09PAT3_BH09PAT3_5070 [soil metagenome]
MSIYKQKMSRIVNVVVTLLAILTFVVQPAVSAELSKTDLEAINGQRTFYGDTEGVNACADSDTTELDTLEGTGNQQKAFNYFVAKLSSDDIAATQAQAAAIIGNLMQESGVNPKSHQGGGGPGRGIAQWTVDGRWVNLLKYADANKLKPFDLTTQLDFMWMELNGTPPAGDYSGTLKTLKGIKDVEQATIAFETTYEAAGKPVMENRIKYAKQILAKYGNGTAPSTSTGTEPGSGDGTVAAVTGIDASCATAGAINCDGAAGAEGTLDAVRQNVVCLAQAELALWTKKQMKPGTDFFKYESGGTTDEQWCADFASWIYNKAGYPISENAAAGRVPAVSDIQSFGQAGKRFSYHEKAGYTPVPGDLVIYKEGWSHVNIVVSVNANQKSMKTIGGNEGGDVSGTGTDSSVKGVIVKYASSGDAYGSQITGYVSPKGTE